MSYINFNNAGSSLVRNETLKTIKSFFEYEQKYGGYFAEKLYKKKLDKFYSNTSKLINCNPNEISFLQNSTLAWNFFLSSVNLHKEDNVVILDNEYGSNIIGLLNKKIKYKISKINDDGRVCLKNLKRNIDCNTKIVFACHIASQCGDLIDIETIGNLIKKINKNIIFVVDACQSLGQAKIDVKKQKCDVVVGSGRKYLRGPRGTGLIYISSHVKKEITPSLQDMKNVAITHNKKLITKNQLIFEVFEYSPALKLGLSNAIENINGIGIETIEKKIKKLSYFFKSEMKHFDRIVFYENPELNVGINTFSIKGFDSLKIHDFLLRKKILTSVSNQQTSPEYFKKKINSVVRVSFHYYNKLQEIKMLKNCLIDLISK